MKKLKFLLLTVSLMHFVTIALCAKQSSVNHAKHENINQQKDLSTRFFTENKGQIKDQNNQKNNDVLFLLNGTEFNVQLRKNGFSYDLHQSVYEAGNEEEKDGLFYGNSFKEKKVNFHRVDFDFINHNKKYEVISQEASSKFYCKYYTEDGLITAKNFSKVTYKNIYNHIDIEFIIDSELGFKYNILIHPGGKINDIDFLLKGAESIQIENDNLQIHTSVGSISESIPYSEFVETKKRVDVRLQLINGHLQFNTDALISGKTLLIDPYPNPTRKWGTFIGGDGTEGQYGGLVDIDANNNLYMIGTTPSTGIATSGAFQATLSGTNNGYVIKFNLLGVIQWATYFGSGTTEFNNLKVSGSNLYVVGNSFSSGFYTTAGVHQTTYAGGIYNGDAVIAKMDLTGNVIWSTYYGGSGDEEVLYIINPIGDRLFITGETTSSSGISTAGSFQTSFGGGTAVDVFVAEFNAANGTRVWGSYYGGSAIDRSRGLDYSTSNGGSLIFASTTQSTQNLASTGAYMDTKPGTGTSDNDALICSFALNGATRNWATYIGNIGSDIIGDELLVAPNGDFYFSIRLTNEIAGFVTPTAFLNTISPVSLIGGMSYGHIAKFNSSGFPVNVSFFPINLSSIAFNSNQDIICHGQIQDQSNAVVGVTLTPNFIQSDVTSTADYVCVLSADLSTLHYGTTIDNPNIQLPKTIVNLPFDNFYVSGWTSDIAQVPNNISTPGAYKEVATGGRDYYAMLICNSKVEITNSEPLYYTSGLNLTASTGFTTYDWTGQASGSGQSFNVNQAGTYYLTSTDYAGCVSTDTIEVLAPVAVPSATISGGGTICIYDTIPDITIDLTGIAPWTITYTIDGNPTTVSGIVSSPYVIMNGIEGAYAITSVIDGTANSGVFSGSAYITIIPYETPTFNSISAICEGEVLSPLPTLSLNGISGSWSPALNNTATTTYTFTPNVAGCITSQTLIITVNPNETPTFNSISSICTGEVLNPLPTQSLNGISGTWSPAINNTATTTYTFVPDAGVCATTEDLTITVNPLPTINVGTDVSIGIGESITLTASTSENITWNNGETATSIEVSPMATIEYCATATDVNSCVNTDCITVFVVEPCTELFVPTGFSPNKDGNNDYFLVLGNCITSFELMIFDRWGEVVFESENQSVAWDGTYKGVELDPAVFVYSLHATVNGIAIEQKGNITILK